MYFRQRLWRMSILSFQNTTFKRSSYCLKRLFHIISFVDQKDIRPLIHNADYVYTGKRYITEKKVMSPSNAIILHIVNLPGSSFKEAVAKRSNLSVQRHFILKALYYLQVIGFVYIPSCYPWFMVKYKNTCTQPFVQVKSFDTPWKDFLSPWSICFSIM